MSLVSRQTHVVPTHLQVAETVLSLGSLNLSARQFLLLLIGSALSYDLWLHLAVFAGWPGGQVVRFVLALLPALLAVALAFVRLAGRSLDAWVLVVARFWRRPKQLVWRSVRFQEPLPAALLWGKEEADV